MGTDITICYLLEAQFFTVCILYVFVQIENYSGFNLTLPYDDVVCGYNKESGDKVMDELSPVWISISASKSYHKERAAIRHYANQTARPL